MVEQIWFFVTLGVIWLIPVAVDNATGASYRVENDAIRRLARGGGVVQRMTKASESLVVLVALASSCARPPMRLQVEVRGVSEAKVEMVSGETCVPPRAVALPAKQRAGEVRISAPGYYPVRLQVDQDQLAFTAGA